MIRQATLFLRTISQRLTQYPFTLLMIGAFTASAALWSAVSLHQSNSTSPNFIVGAMTMQDPNKLSDADNALYKMSYDAQSRYDYEAADLAMKQLTDRRLVGSLLADRYLGKAYKVSTDELAEWLGQYSTQPEAPAISRLAIARGMDVAVISAEAPLKGDGYAQHLGRSTMPDSWYRGLALWREKNYEQAFSLFSAIGANEEFSDWQRSAGYYWAYRAASQLENSDVMQENLLAAAQFQTTFYGLIAGTQSQTLALHAQAPAVSHGLRTNPDVIRASLMMQIGREDDAEEELRHVYSRASAHDRAGIITLAHEMNLPNLQVRLANLPQLSRNEALFASYPTPPFMVTAQNEVSPALLLAIARNESGFRESSASHMGAIGLIQMLPSTAKVVERRFGIERLQSASANDNTDTLSERLNDPATSTRYGAAYVKLLSQQPIVGRNLVHILSAYNAGEGTVANWKSAAGKMEDPLLYIESIPYSETHNYVLQVLAQYWVYQSLLGEKPASLDAITHGQWPQLMLGAAS